MRKDLVVAVVLILLPINLQAQLDKDQSGAWYMYFWNTAPQENRWGFQGDIQYRNWDLIGDLEQLLLRGGVTYQPKDRKVKLTLGYAHITSGEFGGGNATSTESRIYQEALLPQKIGNRVYLKHRFRLEQRFVETQDFRTRFRYNLFMNIPLNQESMAPGAVYLALYNEIFINGERDIGDGRRVELFDRNRFYGAIGYALRDGLSVQAGYMKQTTDAGSKSQVQLSLHHVF